MKHHKKHSLLKRFLSSQKEYPVLYAITAGLYPMLFYYSKNFTLVNTWSQVGYFFLFFIVIPIISFLLIYQLFHLKVFKKAKKYILPFLNIFTLLFLLKICLYAGIQKSMTLGLFVIAIIITFLLYKQFKKLVVIQIILSLIGVCYVFPNVIKQINYTDDWTLQPDAIKKVIFKKTPNVYFIQPDGYVNFSELDKGYYKFDNSDFSSFLNRNKFIYYNDFRSNYSSTLSSNSATFMMKHHYYNRGENLNETLHARDVIITKNAVLDVFKNNHYKTHFLTELPYLLLNRPKMGYDFCNYKYSDISFIGTGLGKALNIEIPLIESYKVDNDLPKFYFMQLFNPGHITRKTNESNGIENEKIGWKESLDWANKKLKSLITLINTEDPNALIIIMADHGGYVGMKNAKEIHHKTSDRDLIYSIFSSTLAIKWPEEPQPSYKSSLKSAVNVFRVVFSYLGENEQYLQHLQPNESYVIIKNGAPKGTYQYINDEGMITFNKFEALSK